MSGEIAISVQGLSKAYTIAHEDGRERHNTLAEALLARLRHPLRRPQSETFWALRDITLDIHKGDVVGIIGRNGAGKSTLLKVLSRITEPTGGVIDLYGRIGSLLEVGTGFHPELTGRENVYLNGHILGMRRREIDRQFDAIVDFAGVERFLDTPVKRYSSGMYVRLAFAVAAHLDSDILVVDEVLAVGDSQFQNKCLGKMGDVARSGRTVLLVSHNMAAVSNLCTRAVVLNAGNVHFAGQTETAVRHYLALARANQGGEDDLDRCRPGWAKTPLIRSVRMLDGDGNDCRSFMLGSDITIEMAFEAPAGHHPIHTPVMGVVLNHPTLGAVGGVNTRMTGLDAPRDPYERGVIRCRLLDVPLLQGTYSADVWLGDGAADVDMLAGPLTFEIEAADIYNTGAAPIRHLGTVFLRAQWELDDASADSTPSSTPATTADALGDGEQQAAGIAAELPSGR